MTATGPTPALRPATADDSEACFRLFWASISDLAARLGVPWQGTAEERWPAFADLYALLVEIAAEWWVAEDDGSGELVGYARSIERGADGGLFELSEFFVHPGRQAAGVGRALLERAFPVGRGGVRAIIATSDVRALARYHRAETSIQFPILGLNGTPVGSDAAEARRLEAEPIDEGALASVVEVERSVLGHGRGMGELRWLLEQREGWLYRRDGAVAGFAFAGRGGTGPIATTEPEHIVDVLRHVESRAVVLGLDQLSFDVPAPNVPAIRYLLARGYRFDAFATYLMANRPFGRFDRFIGFSPPFIL